MKKLIIGLAVVAGAVVVGAPYATGVVAEKKSKELIDKINADYPEIGSYEIVDYDRGMRSSTTSYKYILSNTFQEALQIDSIDYTCDLAHGIVGVDFDCKLANSGAYKEFLEKHLAGVDPLSMTGSISAFGEIEQVVSVEPMTIELDTGEVLKLSEKAVLTTIYNQGSSTYDIGGEVPKVVIEDKNNSQVFVIDGVELNGDLEDAGEGLFLGDVSLTAKKITGSEGNEEIMLVDGFEVKTDTSESADKVSSVMEMKVKSTFFPNQTGGKDSFSNMALDIGVYDLDKNAYVAYLRTYQDMQKKLLANPQSAGGNNQPDLSAMAELVPVLEEMLKENLRIKLNSSFEVDGKASKVLFDVKLLNNIKFSEMTAFLFSPDEALKNFKGNVDVELNKTLTEKYPQLAFMTAGLPIFEKKDDGVELKLAVDNGLKLNGKETTVQELQGLFR